MIESIDLSNPSRIISKQSIMRKKMNQYFKRLDEHLVSIVEKKELNVITAQDYFQYKIMHDPYLTQADKERFAKESKVWAMPVD